MSEHSPSSGLSKPVNIRNATPTSGSVRPASPAASSHIRTASMARLASPVPSHSAMSTPSARQVPTPADIGDQEPKLATGSNSPSTQVLGHSALAAALAKSRDEGPRHQFPSPRNASPAPVSPFLQDRTPRSNYGSIDNRSIVGSQPKHENPEIVRRHLVQPGRSDRLGHSFRGVEDDADEEFSSLQLQGGDIHRQVYKWSEENERKNGKGKSSRSRSVDIARPEPEEEVLDINSIKVPGGFRRNFLRRAADDPDSSNPSPHKHSPASRALSPPTVERRPQMVTSNFLEFLTLYGHFAGEELEDDDETPDWDDYFASGYLEDGDQRSDQEPGEGSALLTPRTPGAKRRKKERERHANTTPTGAILLLLKSFVGTGVLFLPKAFLNGGMLFSSLVLLAVALVSYYCFILLVNTRLKIEGSFGDIGGILYGRWLRTLILASIVLSQLGFVSAYIVFTSENLQAFILAVSKCKTWIDIKFMVLMQLIIFLPLSLIRDISKLGFTALIADAFILLGLVYLYFYDVSTIAYEGVADIKSFNPTTWTLFIGTAIFTFEGVGLIIPIQESMKRPEKFPGVLALVMIIITIIFTSAGALSYAAYGSTTKTVILLNLPQDDKFVNAVQFLYSLAILLSTPLQLFPAIRIMENELFTKSGKFNRSIKWSKNIFRFCLVMFCALVAWIGANDLDKFVALVGSFACVPLVYVYPPLLHIKAVASSNRQKVFDVILCCVGMVGCAYTTVLTLKSWVAGGDVKSPGYCDT